MAPLTTKQAKPEPEAYPSVARTSYVRQVEQLLKGSGPYIPDPDFGLKNDPDFWVKLDRNPTIRGARDYRRHLIAGPRYVLKPPSPADQPLVPYAQALLGRINEFASARFGLADAAIRGLVVGRMMGGFREFDLMGDGTPRRWYEVRKIRIMPRGRWQIQRVPVEGMQFTRQEWGVWDYDQRAYVKPPDQDWYIHHLYQDTEDELYGRDMGGALYYLAHAMSVLGETSLDTAERFGAPWILAKMSQVLGGFSTTGSDIESWASINSKILEIVKKMRAHNILIGDDRIALSLLEGNLRGADLIKQLLDDARHEARILLLGSNLPTSAVSGGSFALAQVQDESTRRLVRFDRQLMGERLTNHLVAPYLRWNAEALSSIPDPLGSGRTLADLQPPILEIQDEELDEEVPARDRMEIAKTFKLRVRKAEAYAMAKLMQPAPDEPDVVDFGDPAMQGGSGGGMFNEHSPVWLRYAAGRLS